MTLFLRLLLGLTLLGAVGEFRLSFGAAAESEDSSSDNARAARTSAREALVFRNGDLIYGLLESISPTNWLRWRHGDVEKAITFKPDNIAEIHFPPRTGLPKDLTNRCRLQLQNGDELEGSLQQLDQDKAILQTWYAGSINIPRPALQSLVPVPPEGAVVFEGPAGLEDWTIGKVVSALGDAGEWKFHNGAFYATNAASIARDVHLPDEARIEFDLSWKGLFQLALALYTDYFQPINLANKDTEPEFGGFYSLQLNSFSANLLPVKKNDPLRYLGQVSVPAFNQKNTAHVEVRASKPKRSIALLVDGELVKQWTETEDFIGQGKGVRFVHQGQGKIKLSHFRVLEWDGQFEEKATNSAPIKQDFAKLRNGDRVSGVVETIDNGKMAIQTGGTKLNIPLQRVKLIEFAGPRADTPSDALANIRAVFARGGMVTFQLENWENGKVVGSSPNFGQLTFDSTAFSRIELDLQSVSTP